MVRPSAGEGEREERCDGRLTLVPDEEETADGTLASSIFSFWWFRMD